MGAKLAQLRYKEIISISDGSRLGYVGDLEVELDTGQVRSLVVPGRRRFLGLLGREPERHIPWSCVRRFGPDTILVENVPRPLPPRRRGH